MSQAIRAGIDALGLEFVAKEGHRADTVTGFFVPKNKAADIRTAMKREYKVEVAKGFGELKDDSLRVGHFGNISKMEVTAFLTSLEESLMKFDSQVKKGITLEAAAPYINLEKI